MNHATRRIPAALPLFALLLALCSPGAGFAGRVDGVAAVVGDRVILRSELDIAAGQMLSRLEAQRGRLSPELVAEVRAQALQNLIDSKLLESFADRLNLSASDVEIDNAVAGIAAEENVSPDDVYRAAQNEGLSRERYRRELGRQITRMKVVSSAVRQRVSVTEAEVRELFESRYGSEEPGIRVEVRHILLPVPEEATPEERKRVEDLAEKIRERALEGSNFAGLARQFSRAPSAEGGGRTMFREGEVDPAFAEPLFTLPIGEITEVIQTQHGYNIFRIEDRFDPTQISFEDVAPALYAEMTEAKTAPEFEKWMRERRKEQYIEVLAREDE
jgi:peptidyl-prolyl cis-trans isomerase SurA